MLRKLLLLSLCVPVVHASTDTNTPSPTMLPKKTRIIKVRMLPVDGTTLERCVNQRVPMKDRVNRHDAIIQGQKGRIFTDNLSMIEAEIGRVWTGSWGVDTVVEQYRVYQLINLARALESCSRTYEIEIPVNASAEDQGDGYSDARFIAILKKDGSGSNIYVVESLRPE